MNMDINESAVTHYAILIGVDAYPTRPLQSCVRDTETIRSVLKRKLKGSVKIQSLVARQTCLTGEQDGENGPSSGPDWPTCRNVTSVLETVTTTAKPGDYILIHYSGHGTRMEPAFDISNNTTGDLALVLLEGRQSTDRYLRGCELAGLLAGMTQKGLIVTIVLDCCFSASVYRNSELDGNVRFLPHEPAEESIPMNISTEDSQYLGYRDGSMRDNWLIDPDRYTILTACGPHEIAKGGFDVADKGKFYGTLSYFLSQTLSDHGLNRKHKDIFRHIRSVFEHHCLPQSPVLYGNSDQGFFGMVKQHAGVRQVCVVERKGYVQLLSGRAHGVCQGDQLSVGPLQAFDEGIPKRSKEDLIGKVTEVGPLTSKIQILGGTTKIQTGWVAEPLKSLHLSTFIFQLDPRLPCHDGLLEAMKQRSLGRHELGTVDQAIRVVLGENNDYKVVDESLQHILHIPSISYGQGEIDIEALCGMLEHLTRFKMVKNLTNNSPTHTLRQSVKVQMTVGDRTFESDEHMKVQHKGPVQLIVTNLGNADIFVHVYNMGPCGRVKNISGGAFMQIPPKYVPPDRGEVPCTGIYKKKIRMKVPPVLKEGKSCNDIVKVFVTSKATSFETLELPDFQQLGRLESAYRETSAPIEGTEDWMAFNFNILTVML